MSNKTGKNRPQSPKQTSTIVPKKIAKKSVSSSSNVIPGSSTLRTTYPNQGISTNITKTLSSRIANLFLPSWISNSYAASSRHLGLSSENLERTAYLALSLILECTKNYFIYLYFYIEYKKSLEDIINTKPVDPIALYTSLFKFTVSIICYVGAQAFSSALLKKFIDSLATAMKNHLTKTWIEDGAYNGNNYLPLKKNQRFDASLVISRDVSQFVTSTAELLYSITSNLSSTIAAISIFWTMLDAQMLTYCLGLLITIKIISHFIGASLKNLGHEQKLLEEKHFIDFTNANKQSESIELCHGAHFETQTLAKYLQEALTKSNIMSTLSGLIGFTTEATSFGSFCLGMWFCYNKIVSGMLTLEDIRTIGISINYIISFVMLNEKNMPLIVRSEVAYKGMQMMNSINNLWQTAIKNRDDHFTITETKDNFSFEGIVKDPYGNVLYSTLNNPLILKKGKSYKIDGPSGSGKSTIIRALAGIWPYVEGKLSIPKKTCIIPQTVLIRGSSTTLLEIFRYPDVSPATTQEIAEIKELMLLFKLDALIALLTKSSWQEKEPDTKTTETVEAPNFFNTLSGGEKKRLAIISVLIKKPDFLILDEATAGIDEETVSIIEAAIIKRLPNSIILSINHSPDSSRSNTPRGDRVQKKSGSTNKKITIKEAIFQHLTSTLNSISEED